MDTIVVTTAITGAVGAAGIVAGILNNKSTGSAARQSAEADRARLADKRRIYALAVSCLNVAALAGEDARSVSVGEADAPAKFDDFRAAVRAASEAVSELQLIVERPAVKLAKEALAGVSNPGYPDRREELLDALRADLHKEADRSYMSTGRGKRA